MVSILLEQDGPSRYMTLKSIAPLSDNATVTLPAA